MEKFYIVGEKKKKDLEFTLAQIMSFLLQDTDLNWSK